MQLCQGNSSIFASHPKFRLTTLFVTNLHLPDPQPITPLLALPSEQIEVPAMLRTSNRCAQDDAEVLNIAHIAS